MVEKCACVVLLLSELYCCVFALLVSKKEARESQTCSRVTQEDLIPLVCNGWFSDPSPQSFIMNYDADLHYCLVLN